MKLLHNLLMWIVLLPIYCYRLFLSPFFGRQCNFYPTCSIYTILAVKKYGIIYGLKKGFIRICRCNPLNKEFMHDEP